MGKKSNNLILHLEHNKTWVSSWYSNLIEYSKIVQKDVLLYNYIRSFFLNVKKDFLDIINIRLYRSNNMLIVDLTCVTSNNTFNNKDIITTFFKNITALIKKNCVFLILKKICYNEVLTRASYISYKIAKLIENGVRFRSKLVKLFLKQVKKNCKGVYVLCKGRINNVDMARSDRLFLGSVPLQTTSISLDYSIMIANTKKGLQSVKVWVHK